MVCSVRTMEQPPSLRHCSDLLELAAAVALREVTLWGPTDANRLQLILDCPPVRSVDLGNHEVRGSTPFTRPALVLSRPVSLRNGRLAIDVLVPASAHRAACRHLADHTTSLPTTPGAPPPLNTPPQGQRLAEEPSAQNNSSEPDPPESEPSTSQPGPGPPPLAGPAGGVVSVRSGNVELEDVRISVRHVSSSDSGGAAGAGRRGGRSGNESGGIAENTSGGTREGGGGAGAWLGGEGGLELGALPHAAFAVERDGSAMLSKVEVGGSASAGDHAGEWLPGALGHMVWARVSWAGDGW